MCGRFESGGVDNGSREGERPFLFFFPSAMPPRIAGARSRQRSREGSEDAPLEAITETPPKRPRPRRRSLTVRPFAEVTRSEI